VDAQNGRFKIQKKLLADGFGGKQPGSRDQAGIGESTLRGANCNYLSNKVFLKVPGSAMDGMTLWHLISK
jgi:hypothetical protein